MARVILAADDTADSGSGGMNIDTILAIGSGIMAVVGSGGNAVWGWMNKKALEEEQMALVKQLGDLQAEMNKKERQQQKYENWQELMAQYKKPLLASAFDLQSRCKNIVGVDFVRVFINERNERDRKYALHNTIYVFAEFLGWLEVIRREIVFITGKQGDDENDDNDADALANIIDGIKFQFSGESDVQGMPPPQSKRDDVLAAGGEQFWDDSDADIMQLYAGEMRAIGEAMLVMRADDGQDMTNYEPMGYAEFIRMWNTVAPAENASAEARMEWERSPEKKLQDNLQVLHEHVLRFAHCAKTPTKRLTIMQVLLCKLIDVLDDGRPWAQGPKYDVGNDPQYVKRDFRLMPMVNQLTTNQKKWLSGQPFFAKDKGLTFPGFAEHLSKMSQADKSKKHWEGAFPPRHKNRPPSWFQQEKNSKWAHQNPYLYAEDGQDGRGGAREGRWGSKKPAEEKADGFEEPYNVGVTLHSEKERAAQRSTHGQDLTHRAAAKVHPEKS